MKAVIGIQARMGSRRLPGKVLEKIGELTVLEHVYHRCRLTQAETVVLIPDTEADEALARFCFDKKLRHLIAHCDENDVLTRYKRAAELMPGYDAIVRVTADCPMVPPIQIISVLGSMCCTGVGYASNCYGADEVRTLADGLDIEAFTRSALELADLNARDLSDREHVTTWMRRELVCLNVSALDEPCLPSWRLTVDTPDDLAWFRRVAELVDLRPDVRSLARLIALLRAQPELLERTPLTGLAA